MADIRMTPSGSMEAIGDDGCWQPVPKAAADEIAELRRQLGGGCPANHGGYHTVISQGRYKFCGECGHTLVGVRYCHLPAGAANA